MGGSGGGGVGRGSGENFKLHSNQIMQFNHILSQVWLSKASHTILLKFPLYP